MQIIMHSVRKNILERLMAGNELSFSELMQGSGIKKNHGKLGYHLRTLILNNIVERVPLTRKYRLAERGVLAAELMWDARFLLARKGVDLRHVPMRYVRLLRCGDHTVLFYDTHDIMRRITYSYLLAGLLKGGAVAYVVSEDDLDSERRELEGYGLRLDCFPKDAFTIISAEEWYLRKGKAQAETIMANWRKLVGEKRKAGFTVLYVAGNMGVFFENGVSRELLQYEEMLGRQLNLNLCALCLYDTHRLDENQFVQLNKSHGHSIFKGIALKTT
jgi:hypothetical protein